MTCPPNPTRWFLIALSLFMAGNVFATEVGNFTATAPGNRSVSVNFWYSIRLISPMTGTIDSLGGWFRDNNPTDTANGDDSVVVVLYSNSGNAPNTFLDSTAGVIAINNSSSATHARFARVKTVGATINTGDTLWLCAWMRAVNNSAGIARDGDNTGDYGTFILDTIRVTNGAGDAPPLASPAVASTALAENAVCLFLAVTATGASTSGATTLMGGTYKQVTIK